METVETTWVVKQCVDEFIKMALEISFGMLTAYDNKLYTNKWESSEEDLSENEAIAAVVSAEDPYVGSTHTPHTSSRFYYLKQSGYSNEAVVRLAVPIIRCSTPFLYDEQQS